MSSADRLRISELEQQLLDSRKEAVQCQGRNLQLQEAVRVLSDARDTWERRFVAMTEALALKDQEIVLLTTRVESAEAQASTDALTGVFNRRGATLELERVFHHCEREAHEDPKLLHHLSVIVVDIDDFKSVNDTHGHGVGDAVLRATADHLIESFRPEDIIERHGGDEFIVYLIGAGRQGALNRAQELAKKLIEDPCLQLSSDHRVTLSIGVCHGQFGNYREGQAILIQMKELADQVMYQAKQSPKGTSGIVEVPDVIIPRSSK